jgi:hypothetical protein
MGAAALARVATRASVPGVSLEERQRRLLVRCILLLFMLMIVEGVLRKWVLPQYSRYLYFLRDPLVLITYVLAARYGAFRRVPSLFAAGLALAAMASVLVFLQAIVSPVPNFTMYAAYGWRNYFLYLPLAFLIATQLQSGDIRALCRLSIIALSLASCVAVLQFFSAPDAAINVGIADDAALQFTNLPSARGHVRPAGLFTSIMGMIHLTTSTLALVLPLWIQTRARRRVPQWMLLAGALAVAASLAVSGSRGMYMQVALVMAAAAFSSALLRKAGQKARAVALPAVIALAFMLLFPILSPEGYETISTRWEQAQQSESTHGVDNIVERFAVGLLDFLRVIGDVPLVGFGLGLGGNAAAILGAGSTATASIPYTESDWSRHMVDLGPILGFTFLVYRIVVVVWLAIGSIRATIRTTSPLPMTLFGYVGIVLFSAQITGNGVVNAFCWFYVGVCMASWKIEASESASGPRVAAVSGARPPNLLP